MSCEAKRPLSSPEMRFPFRELDRETFAFSRAASQVVETMARGQTAPVPSSPVPLVARKKCLGRIRNCRVSERLRGGGGEHYS